MSYLRMAIAPSTRATYEVGVAAFRQWRSERGQVPDELPTAHEIGCWVADCADRGGLRAATLRVYVSALSTWFMESRYPGSQAPNPAADPGVQRVLKGIQRQEAERAQQQADAGDEQLPASDLLLPTLLKFRFEETARDRMFYAAACLAVGGGLRASELLGNRHNPERALTRRQLTFYAGVAGDREIAAPRDGGAAPAEEPTVLQVALRVTKTTQMGGVVKMIAAPIIVAAVWRWICATAAREPGDRVFQLDGARPLTTHALAKDLARRHAAAGLGPVRYSGKSWRRGGAGTLAALGLDGADIAALGWAVGSQQWERYANDPQVRRQRALQRGALMEPGRLCGEGAAADRR
jgi:hypothetical protein